MLTGASILTQVLVMGGVALAILALAGGVIAVAELTARATGQR